MAARSVRALLAIAGSVVIVGSSFVACGGDDESETSSGGKAGVDAGGQAGADGSTGGTGNTGGTGASSGTGGVAASGGGGASGAAGGDGGGCTPPDELCGGVCVNTQTDNNNCGTCGTVCSGGSACNAGTCSCATGQLCNNQCVDTQTDVNNCGACGTACTGGSSCQSGVCTCPAGQQYCSGQCVSLTDINHCQNCTTVCSGGTTCTSTGCACPTGQTSCNGQCTNTNTDPAHCGNCTTQCSSTQVCSNGSCGANCTGGTTNCNGSCVNLATDNNNCGTCGTVCSGGKTCVNSACACPTGQTSCGNPAQCVDTTTSNTNCGTCGTVCSGGQSCVNSVCTCPTGQTFCSGQCVNTLTDNNHCGNCTTVCSGGAVCTNGTCTKTAVCGDGIVDPGEQCDDGNTSTLDGCDAGCKYEVFARMNTVTIKGDPSGPASLCVHTGNALGDALSDTAVNQLNTSLSDGINAGTTNIIVQALGLDDLTGVNDSSFQLGMTSGQPDPARGAWPGSSQIDWWYLLNSITLDANGIPTAKMNASVTNRNLTAGPSTINMLLGLGGTPATLEMLNAKIAATTGTTTSTPAPPPQANQLAAGLKVFETISATGTGQGLCGDITVESLAQIPVPEALTTGTSACGSCPGSKTYKYCGANQPVGSTCNSLLDALVGGCKVVACLVVAITPTQPDVDNAPTPGPTLSTSGTYNKVPSTQTTGNKDGYSAWFQFTAQRVHATGKY